MVRILWVMCVVGFLMGCQVGSESASQDHAEIAVEFLDVVLTEPEKARGLLHEDFVFELMTEMPLYAQRYQPLRRYYDRDSYFSEFLGSVGKLLPEGISLSPVEVIASGDKVAVTMTGKADAIYGDYNNQYVFIYTFKDGKIIELREYLSDILVAKSLYGNSLIPDEYMGGRYLEYFWHSKGPNYSEAALENLTAYWNELVDAIDCPMSGASVLRPREPQEEYDLVWMVSWSSEEVRAACFEDWWAEAEEKWLSALDGILVPPDLENGSFLFDTEIGKLPKSWSDSDSFVHSYFFCNLREGMNSNDLHNYRAEVNGIETFSDHEWYMLLHPKFASDNPVDFIWVDMWSTEQDRQSDLANWNATTLPEAAMAMASCGGEGISGLTFDGTVIRE
jgi:ketosteroid isomerase-like protein